MHATRDCRLVLHSHLSTTRWCQDGRGAGRGDREGAAHRSRCNLTPSVLSGLRGSPGRAMPPKVENEQLRKYIEELRDEVVAEQTTAG